MLHFEIYEDHAGEFRWRAVARNGRIMADSGEGYTRPEDARRALTVLIRRVKEHGFVVVPGVHLQPKAKVTA